MIRENSDTLMFDALVRRDRYDPAVDLEHDRLAIQRALGGVIAPPSNPARISLTSSIHCEPASARANVSSADAS